MKLPIRIGNIPKRGIAAVLLTLGVGLLVAVRWPAALPNERLAGYARTVLRECAKERYRPACYDREIPKFLGALSMEEVFEVTRAVQDRDPGYPYCHVLGHNVSTAETARDPERWKDVVARCPSGLCSNGCIHGAFQERFRSESLTPEEFARALPELTGACRPRSGWNPTDLEQATCYHALGHLAMYATAADTDGSLALCNESAGQPQNKNDYRQICYDGVFMQIFQPLEPEDFALVKGKQPARETLEAFCGVFSGRRRGSCISESWPLFREEIKTPEGLTAFCGREEPIERPRCYDAMFYVLTALEFNFDTGRIVNFCSRLPAERARCFADAASRMIETDYRNVAKSADVCAAATPAGAAEPCFAELLRFSTYNFHPGSPAAETLCARLPEPWRAECFNKQKQ